MGDNLPTDSSAPWHMWLIAVLLLLWGGLGAFDYAATIIRFEPYLSKFPEEVLAYYFAAPLWMFVAWAIAAFGGLISAILLFMRNKLAVTVFAVSLLSSIVSFAYSFINPPPDGGAGLLFPVIVLSVAFLILVYMNWLKRRGVLR